MKHPLLGVSRTLRHAARSRPSTPLPFRSLNRLGLSCLLLALLTACGGGESNVVTGNRDGVLHYGNGAEPQGLDPHVVTGVPENGTVENIGALFDVADETGMPVFISPHYYFEHDHRWQFEGTLETLMHSIAMFDRPHALTLEGFEGSGADWLDQYKPHINNGRTVVTSPHKVYGPDSNDLVLQLRKAGISQVVLGGMSSNLCTESHMRALIEAGFEVMVVTDATAGAITPYYDGYAASLVNFRMIASKVDNTENTVSAIKAAYAAQ